MRFVRICERRPGFILIRREESQWSIIESSDFCIYVMTDIGNHFSQSSQKNHIVKKDLKVRSYRIRILLMLLIFSQRNIYEIQSSSFLYIVSFFIRLQ